MSKRRKKADILELYIFDIVWAERKGVGGVAIAAFSGDTVDTVPFYLIENVRRPGITLYDTLPKGTVLYEATLEEKLHAYELFVEKFGPSDTLFPDILPMADRNLGCLREKFDELARATMLRGTGYEAVGQFADYKEWQLRPMLEHMMATISTYELEKAEAQRRLDMMQARIAQLEKQLTPIPSEP